MGSANRASWIAIADLDRPEVHELSLPPITLIDADVETLLEAQLELLNQPPPIATIARPPRPRCQRITFHALDCDDHDDER